MTNSLPWLPTYCFPFVKDNASSNGEITVSACCGSSSAVADPDIRLKGANLICFPVYHAYFFVGGGLSL